jgi:secreted trypsin-like serine protease
MLRCALATAVLLLELGHAPPPGGGVQRSLAAIVGGTAATQSQWPSAVSFGGCDGVLLHARLVVTAAHCLRGPAPRLVMLGNSREQPARTVPVERCMRHPDYPRLAGTDIGFCTLAGEGGTAPRSIPIVPAMADCEARAAALPGAEAVLVGFGHVGEGQRGGGIKRWVTAPVHRLQARNQEIVIGTVTRGACNGDSGSPAFVRVAGGTWRALGIASRMGPRLDGGAPRLCASTTIYTSIPAHVAWLERETGLDIASCQDEPPRPTPAPD